MRNIVELEKRIQKVLKDLNANIEQLSIYNTIQYVKANSKTVK